MSEFLLSKICFLCLKTYDNLQNVFTQDEDNILLLNKIEFLISPDLMLLDPDNPECICSSCNDTLDSFYAYKQMCLENNRRLKYYINNSKDEDDDPDLTNLLQPVAREDILRSSTSTENTTNTSDETESLSDETEALRYATEDIPAETEAIQAVTEAITGETEAITDQTEATIDETEDRQDEIEAMADETENISDKNIANLSNEVKWQNIKLEITDFIKQQTKNKSRPYYESSDNESENENNGLKEIDECVNDNSFGEIIIKEEFSEMPTNEDNNVVTGILNDFNNKHSSSNITEHAEINQNTRKVEGRNKSELNKTKTSKRKQNYNENPMMFPCSKCKKSFKTENKLNNHIKTHNKKLPRTYECHECGKSFQKKQNLNVHMESHSEVEKMHDCSICHYSTKNIHHMTRHLATHKKNQSTEKKIDIPNFPVIEPSFMDKLLKKKRENMYKEYKCHLCSKIFSRKDNYDVHMNYHYNVRNYKCHVCDKRYVTKWVLKKHLMKLHNLSLN